MKDTKCDEVCNPVTHFLYADVFKRFRRGCKPRPTWMTSVDTRSHAPRGNAVQDALRPIYARR